MKKLIFPLLVILLASCSPKITQNFTKTYSSLNSNAEVAIISVMADVPKNAELLGNIKIGDTGFTTDCSYETVIAKAQDAARKAGGNIVKITTHTLPDGWSSCHRITADIFKIDDLQIYLSNIENEVDSAMMNADYALVHLYRPSGTGALIDYDVYLNKVVIATMSSNSYKTVAFKNEGLVTLWAKTESKSEVKIDIKHGKHYYVRCEMTMGVLIGRPNLVLVDNRTGKIEFEAIKNRKK